MPTSFVNVRRRRRTASSQAASPCLLLLRTLSSSFFAFFLFVFFLFIRDFDFRQFQNGHRKRFAEQVALSAHPDTHDGIAVDFRRRDWKSAGFQNDDIAWFQVHDLSL